MNTCASAMRRWQQCWLLSWLAVVTVVLLASVYVRPAGRAAVLQIPARVPPTPPSPPPLPPSPRPPRRDDATSCQALAAHGGGRPLPTSELRAQWMALGCNQPHRASISSPPREGVTTPVFYSGLGGYRIFRIPAFVQGRRALIAFAEARPTVDDHGRIDLVLRRSDDEGLSWGPVHVVASGSKSGQSIGNPVPLYTEGPDGHGVLMLIYCSNAAHLTEEVIRDGMGGEGRRALQRASLYAQAAPLPRLPVPCPSKGLSVRPGSTSPPASCTLPLVGAFGSHGAPISAPAGPLLQSSHLLSSKRIGRGMRTRPIACACHACVLPVGLKSSQVKSSQVKSSHVK